MTLKRIHADGSLSAPIALIGEAGGENEERIGRPFVGASGHKLNSWWHDVGLRRADFWIDNVFPFRPPHNDLAALLASDYLTVHDWAANLHDRIAALEDPKLIVTTGNIALRALMRRALDDTSITITKYRGSLLEYVDAHGRSIKLIPTIHPASIYHQRAKKARGQEKSNPGRTEKHCKMDWERIARELHIPGVPRPEDVETYHVPWTEPELAWWKEEVARLDPSIPITIDIENPSGPIACVGFAWSPEASVTIPLRERGTPEDEAHPTFAARRELIEFICSTPNPKVLQNGPYDICHLHRQEHITVVNYCYDLMELHHVLDPCEDHDLAFMISAFLRRAYHKDEAKGDKAKKYSDSFAALCAYNGMDCCTQIALFYELQERLIAAGRWHVYEECFKPVIPHLIAMMLGGMRTSRLERRIAGAQLRARTIEIQDELARVVGRRLHAKKGLSRKLCMEYIYGELKLPIQRKRGTKEKPGAVTLDEVAKRKLQLRFPAPHPAGVALGLMLEHERIIKLASFLTDSKTDEDGYLRSEIRQLTETGRCSSKKNPFGTGTNLQNQDRDERVRSSFIPDYPDHVILEVDCSQAESRIVYVLSGDDDLYNMAILPPDRFDTHSYNARLIFGASQTKTETHKYPVTDVDLVTKLGYVTYEQRYFGKRVEHGAQRGMGGDTMSDNLLKDGEIRTPEECDRMLKQYHLVKPGVGLYFEWVRGLILRERALTNSWGFRWDVRHEKMDQELYRRAYSFLPQSEVAFILNTWGVAAIGDFLRWYSPREARLLTQVHDSVLISCVANADVVYAILATLWKSLTQERVYQTRVGPRALSMPIEAKIGPNWGFPKGASAEWKALPSVDAIAAALEKNVLRAA